MKSIWIEYGLYGNAGNFDSHFPFSSTTCSISHYLSYCGFWWSRGFFWLLRLCLVFGGYCALCFAFQREK